MQVLIRPLQNLWFAPLQNINCEEVMPYELNASEPSRKARQFVSSPTSLKAHSSDKNEKPHLLFTASRCMVTKLEKDGIGAEPM